MNRLTLTHLTFLGHGKQSAAIEFGVKATVVSGPSNTGKSFIVDAIDFMLGAKELKEIPERAGYSDVLLGLLLPTGESVTLARKVTGGPISLYISDVRESPLPVADSTMSAVHSAQSSKNLSRFLLRNVGLEGKELRKNANNDTVTLSFRHLAHLCVVDETQMQSEMQPALTGNYVTKTLEVSLLRLLLDEDDDSSLIPVAPKRDKKKMSLAKVEVIDQMISDLETQLADSGDVVQLKEQLGRVNRSLDEVASDRSEVSSRHDKLLEGVSARRRQRSEILRESSALSSLEGRFGLLREQYGSDLDRLSMLREAGTFLGFFEQGNCPFCGTPHAKQPHAWSVETDLSQFGASVEAEAAKTEALRFDLIHTIEDVSRRRAQLGEEANALANTVREIEQEARDLEGELRPGKQRLDQLLGVRSQLEKTLGLFRQVDDLARWRREVEETAAVEVASAAAQMDLGSIREFSTEMKTRLSSWGYRDWGSTRYDRATQDIESGDQFRSSQGKGVRAILHAAFTTALMNYCAGRNLPHPGFVVLDSPLVTYREPEGHDPSDLSFSDAFYTDMYTDVMGQVIILENVEPSGVPPDGCIEVHFTMNPDEGRSGFFPPSIRPTRLPD